MNSLANKLMDLAGRPFPLDAGTPLCAEVGYAAQALWSMHELWVLLLVLRKDLL